MTFDSGVIVDDHESSARIWADRTEIHHLLRSGAIPGALTSVALMRDMLDDGGAEPACP